MEKINKMKVLKFPFPTHTHTNDVEQIAMAAANKKETPIFQGRNGMFVDFETLVRIEIDSDFFFLVIGMNEMCLC